MYKILLNMSIIILIKFVSPQHRRPPSRPGSPLPSSTHPRSCRRLAPAPHCLPRRTQDPAVVSPGLPTASLVAPKIPRRLAPATHYLPRRTLGSRPPSPHRLR
jgi:hypothetical protein